MKKNLACYLYVIAGILFAITAIINFTGSKALMGVTYICLAVMFILLGVAYKKKVK